MKVIRFALACSLLAFAASALADFPASFSPFIFGCPSNPAVHGSFTLPAEATCQAAANAANSYLAARCPGFVPNNNACGTTNTGARIDQVGDNDQAGATTVALVGPFCPDNQTGYVFAPYGSFCVQVAHDTGRNLGKFCEAGKCVGDPVNPAINNMYQAENDYVGTGPFPLRFVRFYNGKETTDAEAGGRLGHKWTHTYGRRLSINDVGVPIRFVTAIREDARAYHYSSGTDTGPFDRDPSLSERLERDGANWKLTNLQDEVERYDSTGKLLSVTNRAGLTQTLAYDAAGRLISVTDPLGRALTFTYTANDRIQTMTTPSGTYQYGYGTANDTFDTLASVTYPDAQTRTYKYKAPACFNPLVGLLEEIIDENGDHFAQFTYGCDGSVLSAQHAGGAGEVTFQPQNGTNRTINTTYFITATQSVTRGLNYTSTDLGLSLHTGVTGQPCPSCGNPTSGYDANGNVTSTADWNGNRTNYTYDMTRNLETSRTEGLSSAGATTAQTRTISTQWHATFRLPVSIAEPLRITTFVYDADGTQCGATGALCSKTIQGTTDANGAAGFGATASGTPRTWTYTYNSNGQVLTMDGPRTDVADVTTYTYYANDDADPGKRGNLATVTNAAGQTTSITAYDADGRPATIVDANGLTTTLTYDARERLTSRSVGGETTTYAYDNAGQLIKVTLPDTSFLSYSYDAAHRLTGMQDNLGNKIAYTLDLMGNRTQEQVFDPASTLVQTRSRVYSSINRLIQELGALGQTTQYAYDNQGNVTSVTDPNNNATTNQYDALNRLKQVTDPGLGVTKYTYNGLDALTQVTDPRSLVTGYAVDGLGNLNQQSSPDTGNTANTYDTAGNLLTQTDAKSQVTSYTYDALNRVTLITFQDGSKQAYAYDQGTNGLGRLSSITETDPSSAVTSVLAYAYDQHGRVTSETRTVNGVQYVLGYSYDAAGRLSGLAYPSGRTVAYTFDLLGRVNQVNTTASGQQQVVVQNVAYQPFGVVKSYTLGNGQIYSRTVDQDGRIASYTLGNSNYQISFDPASRITGIAEAGNPANANTYGYDALDRLTSAVLPTSSFGYAYDAVGNRTTKTTGANADTYTYSPTSNRIATLTPAGSPTRSFVFDANGSTTDDGANTYAYDTRGRMVQAANGGGSTTYQVNALGQRIRKTNASDDRVFLYDTRGKLIAETDPGGVLKRELIYLGDIPVGVAQ